MLYMVVQVSIFISYWSRSINLLANTVLSSLNLYGNLNK